MNEETVTIEKLDADDMESVVGGVATAEMSWLTDQLA
jgi:hypothetical protein